MSLGPSPSKHSHIDAALPQDAPNRHVPARHVPRATQHHHNINSKMPNSTLLSPGLSNTTTSASSVWILHSLAASLCPPSEKPPRYCTREFYFGPSTQTRAETAWQYLGIILCFMPYILLKLKPIVGDLYLRIISGPSQYMHCLPRLLQSYLTSSPFTLTLNPIWDFVHLAVFFKCDTPWSYRFKATYLFGYPNDDAAARTALRRNLFNLVWVLALSFHEPSHSDVGKPRMITLTSFSFAATLVPFAILWCSNGEEPSALDIAVKAGDKTWQLSGFLDHLVNMPAHCRKQFKNFEIGWACWAHGILFTCVLISQLPSTSESPSTQLSRTQHVIWKHQLSALEIVPLAFATSLALALFATWCTPRKRGADVRTRTFTAFCGTLCFARVLSHAGICRSWTLWLVCDGMFWAVDESVRRTQSKTLHRVFADMVRGGLEGRLHGQRDMYKEMMIPGP